jgi:hypothetical protein
MINQGHEIGVNEGNNVSKQLTQNNVAKMRNGQNEPCFYFEFSLLFFQGVPKSS